MIGFPFAYIVTDTSPSALDPGASAICVLDLRLSLPLDDSVVNRLVQEWGYSLESRYLVEHLHLTLKRKFIKQRTSTGGVLDRLESTFSY